MEKDEGRYLKLNLDEAEHYNKISDNIEKHLFLAENAAIITLNGLGSLEKPPRINTPKAMVVFLLAKSAKNVRFATIGQKLGYYAGALAALRSAFEALSYAALLHTNPAQLSIWLRNEFSDKPSKILEPSRKRQLFEAKKALFDLEEKSNCKIIKETIKEFIEKSNKWLHCSMRGLTEEFGIPIEDVIPDDFEEAFSKAEEDFEKALDLYALLSKYGKNIFYKEDDINGKEEKVYVALTGYYDEPTLADLALFAFYIGHRVLDLTKQIFIVDDKEFKQNYDRWHDINQLE